VRKCYYRIVTIYEYVLSLGKLETDIYRNYTVYRLKKLWDVTEIMKEYVTLHRVS
jgi:hypothetical protein